jgi:UDP-GlcNAc:undecaprenyl-phosphate GlcNAc-1-phosphate transferase
MFALPLPTETWYSPWLAMLLVAFSSAFLLGLGLVPLVRHYALKANLLDQPGGRKLHVAPVPRLGGVAIFVSVLVALGLVGLWQGQVPLLRAGSSSPALGMLLGGTFIFMLGFLDDLVDLSPKIKLAGQFMAALIAFSLGVRIEALDLPGSKLLVLNALSLPLTVGWLVSLPNALNFIDGVDGLAAGVGVFAAIALALVALFTTQPDMAMLAALLAGGSVAFLVYNLPPARLFMGDSGALFLGFMLASIAIVGVLKTTVVVILAPLLILGIPLTDITFATLRRLAKGQSPFKADADHLHHRLLRLGLSPGWVSAVFYGISVLLGIVVTSYVGLAKEYMLIVLGVLLLLLSGYVLRRKLLCR